jgi:hypothetical protein
MDAGGQNSLPIFPSSEQRPAPAAKAQFAANWPKTAGNGKEKRLASFMFEDSRALR